MKHNAKSAALITAIAALTCASANAGVGGTSITIDANGNATSSSPLGTGFISFVSGGAPDEFGGSGNGTIVPAYAYSTETSPVDFASLVPVQGVVNIFSDAAHTIKVAEAVFLDDGPSYIYFMDFQNDGAKMDFSLASVPANFGTQTPVANLTEGAGGVTVYTAQGPNGPNATPGFMDDGGSPITYTFDLPSGVPDAGSTLGLMGLALAGATLLKRRFGK